METRLILSYAYLKCIRQASGQAGRQAGGRAGRQADRQAGRQEGTKAVTYSGKFSKGSIFEKFENNIVFENIFSKIVHPGFEVTIKESIAGYIYMNDFCECTHA